MASKLIKCLNIGCHESFKHRTQLSRHRKSCKYLAPQPPYVMEEGIYRCTKCNETFSKQSNASRHKGQGCKQKKKVIICCDLCSKTFKYKSFLKQHLTATKKHTKNTCEHCGNYFRKSSDFQKHSTICNSENPVPPVPRKVKQTNNDISQYGSPRRFILLKGNSF